MSFQTGKQHGNSPKIKYSLLFRGGYKLANSRLAHSRSGAVPIYFARIAQLLCSIPHSLLPLTALKIHCSE